MLLLQNHPYSIFSQPETVDDRLCSNITLFYKKSKIKNIKVESCNMTKYLKLIDKAKKELQKELLRHKKSKDKNLRLNF